MKNRFNYLISAIVVLSTLLFVPNAYSNPYVIKDYRVNIQLNKDGSVLVEERLLVNFNEKRRGIIRSIPFRYRADMPISGERAIREQSGAYYYTSVKDIKVKDHPFTTYKDGDYMMVRIGDPDVYLKGEAIYVITYKIWGALNEFSNSVEFPFNVIGHEWDAPIEKARFNIQFPKKYQLKKSDYIIYTGYTGSRGNEAITEITDMGMSGHTNRVLRPYEGITISIRFPKNYFDKTLIPMSEFTDTYWLEKLHVDYFIHKDGSIDVSETMDIGLVKSSAIFIKNIYNNPSGRDATQFIFPTELNAVQLPGNQPMIININRSYDLDWVGLVTTTGYVKDKTKLRFTYKLWGCIKPSEITPDAYDISLPMTALNGDIPVKAMSWRVTMSDEMTGGISSSFSLGEEHPIVTIKTSDSSRSIDYKLSGVQLFGYNQFVGLHLYSKQLDLSGTPYQVFSKNYTITSNQIHLDIAPDRKVKVEQLLEIDFLNNSPFSTFKWFIPRRLKNMDTDSSFQIAFPNYNVFSKQTVLDYSKFETDTANIAREKEFYHYGLRWTNHTAGDHLQQTRLSYTVDGLIKREGDHWRLNMPLNYINEEPILHSAFHFEAEIMDDQFPVYVVDQDGHFIDGVNWIEKGRGLLLEMVKPGQQLFLSIPIKKDYITVTWLDDIKLLIINNTLILISIGILLFFVMIWYFFGRNRKPLVTVMYYPPETLTPAEIGWLEDDKIHNRDMISLIYYWAAKGYLEIEEKPAKTKRGKPDFLLIKKKDPKGNQFKDYEKTMFNGLFKGKSSVLVSSLKNKFYVHLAKAKKELEKHGRQNAFYVPGTRGFGSCLIALSILILAAGLLFLGLGIIMEDQSYAFAFAALGIGLFIIGRLMPKKGQFGFRKYEKILGFKAFMELAEKDRLRLLLDENPSYFEQTIPYAVAFGMAESWAEKFEGLTVPSPGWYRGGGGTSTFNTILFTDSLNQSMNRLSTDMSSRPSSSGSGGSSFGGGGFSGGGGFGGGGGSSW